MNIDEINKKIELIKKQIDISCENESSVVLPFDAETKEFVVIERLNHFEPKKLYSFVKRVFDIISAFIGLIVLAIPMLIIAVCVKSDSEGPVIYKQKRVGLNGKSFYLYKFRSMAKDAEQKGAQWAKESDSRVTKVGNILRKTRLDELPQLLNILKGDMSVVGPRPERPVYYRAFRKYMDGFEQRLLVKPGLTGYAQINGGYDISPDDKCKLDLLYIRDRSVFNDIVIIFKTLRVVVTHDGAR